MIYETSTKLPAWAELGSGLSYSSGILSATGSAQVNSDWNATTGVAAILNKPVLAYVATSGSYDDLTDTPTLATVATTGEYDDLTGKPTVNVPVARTLSLSTAYQCTDNTAPCFVTVNLQAQSSISLSGTVNNEGAVILGSTSAVASGTGSTVGVYKNTLGGGLVVGLSLTTAVGSSYSFMVPTGHYFAVRQTVGSGLQIVSAFEQSIK